ncbi:MAG: glycosyltransferase family 2 protein [Bacteroidota bacterium]
MISFLIPVFNRNIVSLITALHNQLATVKEKGEIIVMDDASTDESLREVNRKILTGLDHVKYIELTVNAGRNIIRHKLAAAAKYDTFIFLDADSSFPDTLWLRRYLNALSGNTIIMGGRAYKESTPGASTLHFHYGTLREQNSASQRSRHPYRSFLACNFLISKHQLSQLIIDQHLHGYCHEDTFMGLQFEKLGIAIKHIDNPVNHEGIDNDELFMKKQQEALENLQYLYHAYSVQYNFGASIKIIRVYRNIISVPAGKYMLNKIAHREHYFRSKALQSHSLFWLDVWKLVVFHRLSFQPAA